MKQRPLMSLSLYSILLSSLLWGTVACDDEPTRAGEAAGEVAGEMVEMPFDASQYSGAWNIKVRLVDVGSIEVDFVALMTGAEGVLETVDLSVVREGETSGVISRLSNTPVNPDGSFTLTFNETTIPGAYSPTGSDVVVSFTLNAVQAPEMTWICGEVLGEVVTLSLPIMMSTFGAVPAGTFATVPGSCDDSAGPSMLPRVDQCPSLRAGLNVISSGGYDRTFEVVIPSNHSLDEQWPLVMLWHGFGSSPQEMKDFTNLVELAESEGFILVIPSSYPDGAVEWDSLADTDSPDLAFFDDMTKCLSESFSVDPHRIHSTGLSAGGLWTSYLSVFRSEVLASVVGMSPGLIPDYPVVVEAIPFLVAWGGEEDIAYEQDFHILAGDLIRDLSANGHFLMSCNHELEHVWETEFSPWVVRFLLDHPKGTSELPYAAGLPEGVYPAYCEVVSAEE